MNPHSSVVILALCLGACSLAQASDWVEASSGEGAVAKVDTESIRRTGNKVKAWVNWQFTTTTPSDGAPQKSFSSTKNLTVFDCSEPKSVVISYIEYEEQFGGNSVWSHQQADEPTRYQHLAPDTMGEAVWKFACTYKLAAQSKRRK